MKTSRSRKPGTRNRPRAGRRNRHGATTVEFALVAPILFLMIFLCFEFMRLSMMTNLAQDAAYEAARHAMVEGSTIQDATDRADEVLARLNTQNARITVNEGEELTDDTAVVNVRVSIPMADNSFVLSHFTTDQTITAEISLIAERYNGFYQSGIIE